MHWRIIDKMSGEKRGPSQYRMFNPRELSLIIILSALGGAVSVPIGYAGNLLKTVPLPPGTSQILSGLHVIWILLAGSLVRRPGSSTVTGILKGLIELTLFSYHSILVLLISAVEGAVMDLALALLGRRKTGSICLACGLSASTNVIVVWLTVLTKLPLPVVAYMYVISFISGVLFAGYLGKRALKIAATLGFAQ